MHHLVLLKAGEEFGDRKDSADDDDEATTIEPSSIAPTPDDGTTVTSSIVDDPNLIISTSPIFAEQPDTTSIDDDYEYMTHIPVTIVTQPTLDVLIIRHYGLTLNIDEL